MRVLVVDDEQDVSSSLARGLKEAGIHADYATDVNQARRDVERGPDYDVILLDVMLEEDDDGLVWCRQLKERQTSPKVLMLTARDGLHDRLAGFDAGADDYLPKPFFFEEVLARVRALGKRDSGARHVSSAIQLGNVRLDERARQVTIDEALVNLTKTEFDLLNLLLRHHGQVLTDTQICDVIWTDATASSSSALLGVYISRLRKKLHDSSATIAITNHRAVGYTVTHR